MSVIFMENFEFSAWADCGTESEDSFSEGQRLMVKFTYNANPDSPLGEPELSVRQKDNVEFINYNPQNKMWCKVQIGNNKGYVPSSYVMVSFVANFLVHHQKLTICFF